jgi:phosphotransferase system IIB component
VLASNLKLGFVLSTENIYVYITLKMNFIYFLHCIKRLIFEVEAH